MCNLMLTSYISESLNISQDILCYLLGLLAIIPLSFFFSRFIQRLGISEELRHLFMLISGSILGYLVFGVEIRYIFIYVSSNFVALDVACKLSPNFRRYCTLSVAVVDFLILLTFYYYFQSNSYDANFLTPMSIACLNLMGIALDLKDGDHDLKHYPNRLQKMPPYVEFMGYCFSFASFMAGPVVPFSDYRNFVASNYGDVAIRLGKNLQDVEREYYKRALINCAYFLTALGISCILPVYFSVSYLSADVFLKKPFLFRLAYMLIIGFGAIQRYTVGWMIVEASGNISHYVKYSQFVAGTDHETIPETLLCNIRPVKVYSSQSMKELAVAFNFRTNHWARYYIFKRFQFLGSKLLSTFLTVAFLCLWHGFHPGYCCVFFIEFLIIVYDTLLENLWNFIQTHEKSLALNRLASTLLWTRDSTVCWFFRMAIMKVHMAVGLSYFEVLTKSKLLKVIVASGGISFLFLNFSILLFLWMQWYFKRSVSYQRSVSKETKEN